MRLHRGVRRFGGSDLLPKGYLDLRLIVSVLLAVISSQALAVPTAENIAARVRRQWDKVNDYVCEMTFTASGPELYIGKTVVTAYYKKPGKVHFEAKEGFAVLPKDMVFVGDPFEQMGSDLSGAKVSEAKLDGAACYVIKFSPMEGERPGDVKFWVDRNRWHIIRTEMNSPDGGFVSGRISHTKIGGKWWLPSEAKIEGKTSSRRGGPSSFTAEIKFRDYRVNSGIPESVFRSGGTAK